MTINEKKIKVYNIASEIEKLALQIKVRQEKIQKLNMEILEEEDLIKE